MSPTLIVTRPRAQAVAWVRELTARGLAACSLPLIDIGAVDDPAPLRRAWQGLADLACVMFVSVNAVQHFFAARPPDGGWPPGLAAACTGQGTRMALVAAGVPEACIAAPGLDEAQESESLWRHLVHRPWRGRDVLIVRGEDGRDWLARQWGEAGATLAFVTAYTRSLPTLDAAGQAVLAAAQQQPAAWCWHFSSTQAVRHLVALAPGASWALARAMATHPRIAQAVSDAGFGRVEQVAPGLAAAWQGLHHDGQG